MKSCTIIIPHLESFFFLEACIRWIEYMKHPEIEQTIIIVDDNSQDGSFKKIQIKYAGKHLILQTGREDKEQNAGVPLDFASQYIKTDYVCSLDCDCIPISKNWLKDLIDKIDEGYIFAGRNSAFEKPYMAFGKNNPDMKPFLIIDNCYRVSTTKDFKFLSMKCGFKRNKKSSKEYDYYSPKYTPMIGNSDTGVAANYYAYSVMGRKSFRLPIVSVIGRVEKQGSFGQNIADLVFHMSLSSRRLSSRSDIPFVGEEYEAVLNKILAEGFTDEIVKELLSKCTKKMYDYFIYEGNNAFRQTKMEENK